MYRGFKLNIVSYDFGILGKRGKELIDYFKAEDPYFSDYLKKGKEKFERHKQLVNKNLDQFIIGDSGIIDGSKLQEDWFPTVNCDIFISHSHKDEDLAIALAGWLYETFGLESFIDSCIWGYADDLLEIIDDEHCRNSTKSYSYKRRNFSTSHVHMMLNMALMQMIDKTECLFFLNTPNSIDLSDIETRTLSPWIYSEIGISQMIEKKSPRTKYISDNLNESLRISYKLDLSHLANIDHTDLLLWKQKNVREERALNSLYEIIPAPKKR
ncbi:MAG: hypothetical protein IKP99_03715 [Bacteroidales bacterium]|nr:hypothetical protein [Bacteroidales bacterium]